MNVTNKYGRPWDELDALKAQVHLQGAFTLLSADGIPLCGRYVPDMPAQRYVAPEWSLERA